MLTLTYESTIIKCTEVNAPKYRDLIDSGKPPKFKKTSKTEKRSYPVFVSGMTTREYIAIYKRLNDWVKLSDVAFHYSDRVAPMLDYTQPEVITETLNDGE
jgi:hypothetical protein